MTLYKKYLITRGSVLPLRGRNTSTRICCCSAALRNK